MKAKHVTTPGLAALAILFSSLNVRAQNRGSDLPVLTTTHAAHELSVTEAAKAYPVRLRAVVTYYDPYLDFRHAALFVSDATGSIFVALSSPPVVPLYEGELIEVVGVSGAGDFAPIVDQARARVIGHASLPLVAEPVTLTKMLTGAEDGHWVEIEGVVRSMEQSAKNVVLNLALIDGPITATTIKQPDVDYAALIDARVRIRGNSAPSFNHQKQMTGARILFPDMSSVTVEEPAPVDPFALPLAPVGGLLRFTANAGFRHRVHVRGSVTLFWADRVLCIQDGARGLCSQTRQTTPVSTGEVVDVVGFPAVGGFAPTLTSATYRPAGLTLPVQPLSVTASEALRGDRDGTLVTLEGKLIGEDRAARNPTLILSSGRFVFYAERPANSAAAAAPVWQLGSTLRLVGICSVKAERAISPEGFLVPDSFRINLRSASDIVVVARPPWWGPEHAFWVISLVMTSLLIAIFWVWVLRRQVTQRTRELQTAVDELQQLSRRDGLTGMANRRTFDEALRREVNRANRSSFPLSLLMLDIDHFKALNDDNGHQHGDQCLIDVAGAIRSVAARCTDVVARYGGEEFAVILPATDHAGALEFAERIRTAVLRLGIPNLASPFTPVLSVSVGVATFRPGSGDDPAALIRNADSALYSSKRAGRNRVTSMREPAVAYAEPVEPEIHAGRHSPRHTHPQSHQGR